MTRNALPYAAMLTSWYRALLHTELESIFTNAPQAPNVLANDTVRNAYASATGKLPMSTSPSKKRRIPGPEDSCPICYESMHDEPEGSLTFCDECGNALHSECFEQCMFFFVPLPYVSVDHTLFFRASKSS